MLYIFANKDLLILQFEFKKHTQLKSIIKG